MKVEIIGTYPVEAAEPCHLVELVVSDHDGVIDLMDFTQELSGRPRSNWQVPWDERVLDLDGKVDLCGEFPEEVRVEGRARIVFFFHYLDHGREMLTPTGPVRVPQPTMRPERLEFMKYESPC